MTDNALLTVGIIALVASGGGQSLVDIIAPAVVGLACLAGVTARN